MGGLYRKFQKDQQGNALILVALAMGALLLAIGLVIDGGNLFVTKSHLQKTANAAALSGAQEIVNSEGSVAAVVDEILVSHQEQESLAHLNIEENSQVHVELKKDVPLFFATLFGIESVPIQADAKAGLNPMGRAKGAVPLGIDETVDLVYGDTYALKVDAGDSVSGNFGVLALEGPGAKLYGDSLTHGFDDNLQVGDIINTQTGNIAGATRTGINYRIDNCPYPDGEYEVRECPRVMLVIVYKPHSQTTNQLKSVEITGFAYFYVTDRMKDNDDSIKGIFIKRAGPGLTGENSPHDRGAYAIKLME
ncbi:pilus assembly protein TadG-related protein [Virgibacillus sp. C22-A2]|uniref:Pilus assembly protein TadG-related protein n=1 Tax=Virgibacillus tibetensis TaxID=3042313 RepID=A0ABU6KDS5_9BACI|nr:pilus assembly protein TadG-related protein [Virgibacillus sp. C22-A2]